MFFSICPLQAVAKVVEAAPEITVLWTVQPHVNEAVLTSESDESPTQLTNAAIDTFNRVVETLLAQALAEHKVPQFVIWSSLTRVADMTISQMPAGVYLPDKVTDQGNLVRTAADILYKILGERHPVNARDLTL